MSPYSFVVLLVVIVSVANAGEKVCYRVEQPCGFQCIAPKDNEPKAGKCPLPSAEVETPLWGICDGHFCDVDSDCKGNQKCCYNPCGSPVCVAPQ
jgi:hypothetical protein